MKLSKTSYKLWRNGLALLTLLAFVPPQMLSKGRLSMASEPSPLNAGATVPQAELQALSQFGRLLADYGALYKRVTASARPQPDDLKRFQDIASQLKGQVTDAVRNYESVLSRLKDDGQFQDEQKFNKAFQDKFDRANVDGRAKGFVSDLVARNGGARAALQRGPSAIAQLPREIDADLQGISAGAKPVTVAFLRTASPAAAPYGKASSVKCGASCFLIGIGIVFSEVAVGVALIGVGAAGAVEHCFDD
jgi:hypothetical protein